MLEAVPGLHLVWDVNHTVPELVQPLLALAPRFSLVHVSDTPLPDTNHHLPLGRGSVDLTPLAELDVPLRARDRRAALQRRLRPRHGRGAGCASTGGDVVNAAFAQAKGGGDGTGSGTPNASRTTRSTFSRAPSSTGTRPPSSSRERLDPPGRAHDLEAEVREEVLREHRLWTRKRS